ncbi:hypothetical protein FAES_5398 [Fibrella aestuarina BUZ 2]|uniref:Kelch repeat-containing protein n=1 Tax=Fibrella aestuarina BUZ 2 TaxID=1166018 RepID=I0KGZ4_9BACT|nr:hypothetical protein [Fibrella aestuarina]CCH03397.1 hypothetical protein FAES_5398 [Fibrella aestuarina BUZ 2]
MIYRSLFFVLTISLLLTGCDHIQDPAAQPGSWQTLGSAPDIGYFLVTLNGKLYAGQAAPSAADPTRRGFKRLVSIDPRTGAITQQADLPGEPLTSSNFFVVNNKLYAALGTLTGTEDVTGIEKYNPNVYQYDPTTDRWQQVESPEYRFLDFARLTGATTFTYGNKGTLLFGTYRQSSLTTTTTNEPFSYTDGLGWGRSTVTITPTVPIPYANDDNYRYFSVFRQGGFGFVLNNRVYTGGGEKLRAGPGIISDRIARDIWAFRATETVDGKGLDLALEERITTPTADINLTNASQAFVHNNRAYIIGNFREGGGLNGSLISFTPTPNEWKLVMNSPQNLSYGVGLGNRLYFLAGGQLLSYVPE